MQGITKKKYRKTCQICHKNFFWISYKGCCKKCLAEKVEFARLQIKHKQGPIYEKYRKGILNYFGK